MNKELFQKLLAPLHPENPTGEAIRYTLLYDQIQEARRSEDETLPQGIWQASVKKADWPLVETLCLKGLLEQSKDVHLVAWLMESWTALHGLEGLSQGVELLHRVSENFWPRLNPQLEPGDPSQRLAPYEWIDHQLPTTLLSVGVTSTSLWDLKNFSFADWMHIQHLEMVSKKQKDPNGYIQKEVQKGAPQPAAVRASMRSTPHAFYQDLSAKIKEILEKIALFEKFLKHQLHDEALLFYDLKKQLDAFSHFSLQGQQATQEPSAPQAQPERLMPSDKGLDPLPAKAPLPEPELPSREKAYAHLATLAALFMKIDPHSPTPFLLRRALSWQKKSLLDVFQEFRQDPQALQVFLALLDVPAPSSSEESKNKSK